MTTSSPSVLTFFGYRRAPRRPADEHCTRSANLRRIDRSCSRPAIRGDDSRAVVARSFGLLARRSIDIFAVWTGREAACGSRELKVASSERKAFSTFPTTIRRAAGHRSMSASLSQRISSRRIRLQRLAWVPTQGGTALYFPSQRKNQTATCHDASSKSWAAYVVRSACRLSHTSLATWYP